MKGALSDPSTFFFTELFKHAHKGTPYALSFGGDPAAIPRISHEDLVSYYARHYQQPVFAVYDSSLVGGEGQRREFLERTLEKILTEVSKPRQVLAQNNTDATLKDGVSAMEALKKLRLQQQNAATTDAAADSSSSSSSSSSLFHFAYGPADPTQDGSDPKTTSSRIGVLAQLHHLIKNKDTALEADHVAVFKLELLLHILLRPPSGELYRELLHNSDNTGALSSLDAAVVAQRVRELTFEAGLAAEEVATLRAHKEEQKRQKKMAAEAAAGEREAAAEQQLEEEQQQEQQGSGTTIDLIPGSGLDRSAQTPALFVGLQNVPAAANEGESNAELSRAKCQLLSLIVSNTLRRVAETGLDGGLVGSALHEYELALRTRDRMFAVRAAMSSVGAVMRGMDPFLSHDTTKFDNLVAGEIKKEITGGDAASSTVVRYFSEFVTETLLPAFAASAVPPHTIAVVCSQQHAQRLEESEKKEIAELKSKLSDSELKGIFEQEEKLLAAQKRVDDGASLPTLDMGDIARDAVNFSPPVCVIENNKNSNNSASVSPSCQPVQSFVTNTAGLAYVRLLLPLQDPAALFTGDLMQNDSALLLPLFGFLFDKLGTNELTVGQQDVAVRSVCSGFSCGLTLSSLPTGSDHAGASCSLHAGVAAACATRMRALRALSVSFHAMPENVDKALALLQQTFESNLTQLWETLVQGDGERKAMLIQLLAMYASDLESSVMHNGTQFATSEALLAAVQRTKNGDDSNGNNNKLPSVLENYGDWHGLALLKRLSQIRTAIGELQSGGKDPVEALRFLFPGLAQIARTLLSGNRGATGWCVAAPDSHEKVAGQINEFLEKSVRSSSSSSNTSTTPTTLETDPLVVDEPTLFCRYAQHNAINGNSKSAEQPQPVLHRPLPGANTSHVGCVLPTPLHSEHELAPAFQIALRIASQEFLHREVREIGGAYGSGARFGVGGAFGMSCGVASFASYRDPSPDRTISIFRDGAILEWFRNTPPCERMLREAKLSMFGAIDAPIPPHEVGERTAVSRVDCAQLEKQRRRLLETTLADVTRSVEEFLRPDYTRKAMTAVVLGKEPTGTESK